MQCNAIDPGTEARLAVEAADVAEDLDEDFLGDVGGVGRVLQATGDDGVDGLVILRNELRKRPFRAGLQLFNQSCFVTRDCNGACEISHYAARLHTGCP